MFQNLVNLRLIIGKAIVGMSNVLESYKSDNNVYSNRMIMSICMHYLLDFQKKEKEKAPVHECRMCSWLLVPCHVVSYLIGGHIWKTWTNGDGKVMNN